MGAKQFFSFGSIAALHDNNNLTTSPIGELNNKTRTYGKDPGIYSKDTDTVLHNFYSQQDTTFVKLGQALAEKEIDVCDWLYTEAKLANITNDTVSCLAQLKATFTDHITIESVGEMVSDTVIWLPSYVQGIHLVDTTDSSGKVTSTETIYFKIWLANEYLDISYPFCEFGDIHPIPLSEIDFFVDNNYQEVAARLAKETPDIIESRVHKLTGGGEYPYTGRVVFPFLIYDAINKPHTNMGYWQILEWGNGRDADDAIYEQLRREILANSKYPESVWEEVIPDLFNPLKFYVVPYWERIGMVNKTNNTSNYTPISDYETMLATPTKYFTKLGMNNAHLIKSLQTVPHLYKSILLGFVGKVNNQRNMEKIYDVYPDYSLIPSTDPDFGRMQEGTIQFIVGIQALIAAAEIITPDSIPPIGISGVTENDVLYVTKTINTVKYNMVTRYQFVKDGLITVD